MRRWLVLLVVALLMMPSAAMAQEATPESINDPWIVGDGLSDLASLDYDTFNGAAIIGDLDIWGDPLLFVAFRNDSDNTLYQAEITVELRAASGDLFAVEQTAELYPLVVESGAYAFGYVEFRQAQSIVGLSPSLSWQAESEMGSISEMSNLRIGETQAYADRIVGIATNEGAAIDGKASVVVICFSATGELIQYSHAPTTQRSLVAGESTSFQVELDVDVGCPRYALVTTWANFIIWG